MVGRDGAPDEALYMSEIFKYFDQGLTIGGNLQLDLANSYYIYIMSALYFAVPAVTGQMVLGAKAGAAGLASGAIGGLASESGRAAGQGYTAGQSRIAGNNNGMVTYNERNQAMRQSGLAGEALNAGNHALATGLTQSAMTAADNFISQASRIDSLSGQRTQALNNQAQGRTQALTATGPFFDMAANTGVGLANTGTAKNIGKWALGTAVTGGTGLTAMNSWTQSQSATGEPTGGSNASGLNSSSLMRSVQAPTSAVESQAANGQQVQSQNPANTGSKTPPSNRDGSIPTTNIGSTLQSGINNVSSGQTTAANGAVTANQMNRQVGWEMAQNAAKLGSMRAGMDNQVWKNAQSGLQNFAETQAALASYGNVRNFQEGTADYLGAIGGNSGVVSGASGSLANQSMTGLAAAGELGKANKEKAILGMGGEVNGRSFFGYNATVNQNFNEGFGPSAVAGQYNRGQVNYGNVSNNAISNVDNANSILGQVPAQEKEQVLNGR